MPWRRYVLLASACLPALVAWLLARSTADTAASRIAAGAGAAASLLEWLQAPAPSDSAPVDVTDTPDIEPDAPPALSSAARGHAPYRLGPPKLGQAPSRRGILVRRSAVLAAVRRGIRPSAAAVPQTADHPAGLSVHGWGAAGTGLRDGDIIVSVGGRTPTSVDDVIAAVAGAYHHKVYAISGRVWRSGETIDVSVELPMPREPAEEQE